MPGWWKEANQVECEAGRRLMGWLNILAAPNSAFPGHRDFGGLDFLFSTVRIRNVKP